MTVDVSSDWRTRAACTEVDPDVMHPGYVAEEIAAAKRVCQPCPVRRECLRNALELGEQEGVWGGLTSAERRNLQVHGMAVRTVRKADCPQCGRGVPRLAKGLKRHNRWDSEKGWSHCPGSGSKP